MVSKSSNRDSWLKTSPPASLSVYLEYASYFPRRSGAEVAYLEKVSLLSNLHEILPTGRLLRHTQNQNSYCQRPLPSSPFCYLSAAVMPSVLYLILRLGQHEFNKSSVLAQYLLAAAGGTPTTWHVRGLAVGSFTVIVICELRK